MIYVYNRNKFITKTLAVSGNFVLESWYGYNYKSNTYDTKPFITLIRKHELEFKELTSILSVCNTRFSALHKKTDNVRLYLDKFKEYNEEDLADCIIVESPDSNDVYLLMSVQVHGTINSLTRMEQFDIYAGIFDKFNKYQFFMKLRKSFKIQEYLSKPKILVGDRIFNFNHVTSKLYVDYKTKEFPQSFYERNIKLYTGAQGAWYRMKVYELFFERK